MNEYKHNFINLILKEEKENNYLNQIRCENSVNFIKKYLKTDEGDLFLTLESLIEVNNCVLNKKNVMFRKKDVMPRGYRKCYVDHSEVKKLTQVLVDDWNGRYITKSNFVKRFLEIHPFLDGNGRTCKLLFI